MRRVLATSLAVLMALALSFTTLGVAGAGTNYVKGDSGQELPLTTTNPLGTQIDPWQYKVDEHTYYVKIGGDLWGLVRPPSPSPSSFPPFPPDGDYDWPSFPPEDDRDWEIHFPPEDGGGGGGGGGGGDGGGAQSELMFNDFERWVWYQGRWVPDTTNLGGKMGPMSPDVNGDGRGDYDPTLTRVSGHDGSYALNMRFSFPQDQWCGVWMFANDENPDDHVYETIDVSGYTDVRMWVRESSTVPPPPGDPMKVELKDLSGNMHAVYLYMVPGFAGGPTDTWQEAVFPLPVFSGVNLRQLRMVNIVFDYPGRGTTSGAVEVDTIRFTQRSTYTYPSGLVIDVFNDGRGPNEFGGGCGVAKPSGSTVTITETYVQDSYEGLGALRLDYNRGSQWAAYWNFMYPENWRGRDVSGQNSLQLWAKGASGGERFKIEFKDTSGNTYKVPITRVSGFENGLGRSYGKIAIPLDAFSSNGINLRNVLQVNLVFDEEPNSGTVFVDLMRFSTENAPPLRNERPIAWISSISPNPADGGEMVRFEGGGTDPDGTVVWYEWRSSIDGVFASGPFTTPVVVTRDNLSPGVHTIYFRVRDDRGDWSDENYRQLTIRTTSLPPVANIQTVPDPPEGTAPLTVNFSASGSYDPDGGILTYRWDFDGSSSTNENTIHTYSTQGTYTVVLTVTDDEGDSDNASVLVRAFSGIRPPVAVLNTVPDPPRGRAPFTVQFYGENSYDLDGTIVSYLWDFGDNENSDNRNPVHTYASTGVYRAALTATDNDGLTDTTAVEVWVSPTENTLVRILPEEQDVASGGAFTVRVFVEPSAPVAGMQLEMTFDPSLVIAENIEEGDFLSQGGPTFFNDNENNIINNAEGRLENIYGLIIGGGSTSTPGTFVTIYMRARENVDGFSLLMLENIKVSGPNAENIPTAVLNGVVTVVRAPPWDVNGDHVVDIFDLVLVAIRFGETGPPGWIREDVVKDGVIDIFDLVTVASHFGETW